VSRQIELHVEELVLDGFDAADVRGMGAALEAELGRLLAGGGLPQVQGDRTLGMVDAGVVPLRRDGARGLGSRVASRVYGSLTR
jgi:hypothetical protein